MRQNFPSNDKELDKAARCWSPRRVLRSAVAGERIDTCTAGQETEA